MNIRERPKLNSIYLPVLSVIWFGCLLTFFFLDFASASIIEKGILVAFIGGSITVYSFWLKWAYAQLLDAKKTAPLSFADNLTFTIISFIHISYH